MAKNVGTDRDAFSVFRKMNSTPAVAVHGQVFTRTHIVEFILDLAGYTTDKPLHAMTDAFTAAGFRISVISEPHPVPAARELFPDDFPILDTFPSFLFFVLTAG